MHVLIVGQSTSGKSNLCKSWASAQDNVIVFDPLKSTGWPIHALKFSDPEKFLQSMVTAESAHVYIDEAMVLWEYDYKRANKILYNRRHQGLLVYVIGQRATMILPHARNQCSKVFAFKQNLNDAQSLAGDYNPEVIECNRLPKGEFIAADTFTAERYKLDYTNYPPVPILQS